MTDTLMKDQNLCPHGVDSRTARCVPCTDPSFYAAQQPPVSISVRSLAEVSTPDGRQQPSKLHDAGSNPAGRATLSSKQSVWEFDRYVDGRLKAEGVRISRAASFEEACRSAMFLASPGSVLVLRQPDETSDGYMNAFYKISDLLGLPAMPISPKEAFETVMLPRLRELLAVKTSLPRGINDDDMAAERELYIQRLRVKAS